MKSILEKIYESNISSKYDTTIFDRTNNKNKKLIPSEDENKNFIIARLSRHFTWQLKGRSNKVDDYIEKGHGKDYYWMNVWHADVKSWEAEKWRETMKIGTATTTNINKGIVRLGFTFTNNKLNVTCTEGEFRGKKLGTYEVVNNPQDEEYEDPYKKYRSSRGLE